MDNLDFSEDDHSSYEEDEFEFFDDKKQNDYNVEEVRKNDLYYQNKSNFL